MNITEVEKHFQATRPKTAVMSHCHMHAIIFEFAWLNKLFCSKAWKSKRYHLQARHNGWLQCTQVLKYLHDKNIKVLKYYHLEPFARSSCSSWWRPSFAHLGITMLPKHFNRWRSSSVCSLVSHWWRGSDPSTFQGCKADCIMSFFSMIFTSLLQSWQWQLKDT